jgi:hypothetical protein
MHPHLIAALAEYRRQQCPCGAATQQPYGLCRKCYARMVWQRHHSRSSRRTARRLAHRQARRGARRFAHALSLLRTGKGAES